MNETCSRKYCMSTSLFTITWLRSAERLNQGSTAIIILIFKLFKKIK